MELPENHKEKPKVMKEEEIIKEMKEKNLPTSDKDFRNYVEANNIYVDLDKDRFKLSDID